MNVIFFNTKKNKTLGNVLHSPNTLKLGATLQQDVKDVGRGLLVASVKDKDGILGFRQNPQ
jgi:hypothetical protein